MPEMEKWGKRGGDKGRATGYRARAGGGGAYVRAKVWGGGILGIGLPSAVQAERDTLFP